ncbi:cbb3-type cytochrome oxidase assembly protein CcoS [Saccharophagus degradans]|uniref:Cbb3-type cytochrome oxidase assembly protein CcoS n=1 Tax=Saccharophagus degradans TaxID=86304 RepID=A0AAW7XCD8_9GAMM|nr:cbb3-type cytochrome oxidase assembly protein CcoS [Saccharophagus degradans]MBU2986448.1 cbb3-type cytochrome oxidase assembly protein CcoS [Saccharophagus degradans]MDO6424522.1 cbb3-type cytochrome oxidase assembly protein CcoS [Saccharophagus degradans]MDO6608855.1 cbb3-type cytochrome oxidase assembly protein CcoS [Saccharophagus degradans]
MEAIYLLIPIALVFLVVAIGIFFWAVKNGQYDDLNTEARRILFDNDKPAVKNKADSSDKTANSENNTQ